MTTYRIITASEDRDRVHNFDRATTNVWPEFMLHDALSNRLWGRLDADFPEYQFIVVDADDQPIAHGNSAPLRYTGEGALTPVEIDCERGEGVYVEPNVWMVHQTLVRPTQEG